LGVAYKRKGEIESALKCFKKVLSINHKYVPARLHLIESYLLKGAPAKAAANAEDLIKLFPDDKVSILVDKMIIQGDILIELPDITIISPEIEKAIMKKGNYYKELAHKLKKHRQQKLVPKESHPISGTMPKTVTHQGK